MDRTTGYIGEDNSGKGNIFAIEPRQLYTESPTSDKYAKQGLGGIPGVLLALGIVAGVAFATQNLGSFEEKNNEFANFQESPSPTTSRPSASKFMLYRAMLTGQRGG